MATSKGKATGFNYPSKVEEACDDDKLMVEIKISGQTEGWCHVFSLPILGIILAQNI